MVSKFSVGGGVSMRRLSDALDEVLDVGMGGVGERGEGGGLWVNFSGIAANKVEGERVIAESLELVSGEFGERGPRMRGPIGDCGGLSENRENRENLGFKSVEDIDELVDVAQL